MLSIISEALIQTYRAVGAFSAAPAGFAITFAIVVLAVGISGFVGLCAKRHRVMKSVSYIVDN